MIPLNEKREISSSGVEGTASFEISGKNAAHIMTILRDTLYSDKVLAVLREYAANAWDANRAAGRGDVPIKITLPTYGNLTLSIRDNGPGLSVDEVFTVYNQYGDSTKRNDNVAVGMLGIGSKSGFAYSDSFTIISWNGGHRSTYVAVIDESEKGRVDLLDVHKLDPAIGEDPAETGVEIQIPVKPSDIIEFTAKAQSLFVHFVPRPIINTELTPEKSGINFAGLGTIFEAKVDKYGYSSDSHDRGWIAVMGCIPYRVNLSQLKGLNSSANRMSGVLTFNVGEIQFSASREDLKYGDITKKNLADKINGIIDKYIEHLLSGIDDLSQWDRRLRIKMIKAMHLSVPSSLSGMSSDSIGFDQNPNFKLLSTTYSDKKLYQCQGFGVSPNTRLIFRNERKNAKGYDFKRGDIIVEPSTPDHAAARKALNAEIIKKGIVGIPLVMISSITWTRPASAPRDIDYSRAKAACLVFDTTMINAPKKSQRWTPVTRVPLDTDVYVIMDSYIPEGFNADNDFYDTFLRDRELLEGQFVGGKMPQVVGYRDTKATPVDRAKLKGMSYSKWSQDELPKLLMKCKPIADAVASKVWAGISCYAADTYIVASKLGNDHPIATFIGKVVQGAKLYNTARNSKMADVVDRASSTLKDETNEALATWNALAEKYPMMRIYAGSISQFSASNRDLWIDYIKLIDSQKSLVNNSVGDGGKKEAA